MQEVSFNFPLMFSLTVAVGDTTAPDNIPKPSSLIGVSLALLISVIAIALKSSSVTVLPLSPRALI